MEASDSMSVNATCGGARRASWFEIVAVLAEGSVSEAVGTALRCQEAGRVESRGRVEGVGVEVEWSVWLLRFRVLYKLSLVLAHRSSSGSVLFRILKTGPTILLVHLRGTYIHRNAVSIR